MNFDQQLLTTKEAMRHLDISYWVLLQLIKKCQLPAIKLRGPYRIPEKALRKFVAKRRQV